jgi:prepilin-type N-terminal cleavage/methylation domain-containing protein
MPRLTRARRGFSITELLVTLGILSVIGTIVANLMTGQQRFFQRTNEQMGMRRELRSAMSLIPADLRSISSSGGDLTAIGQDSVQFRAVIGASIICGKANASTMSLPPLDMARNTLTSWYSRPVPGDTVWVFNDSLSRGAEDDEWKPLRITSVEDRLAECNASPYIDATLDATKLRYRVSVASNMGDSVKVGSAVRFTRSTKYTLRQQTSGAWYIHRSQYLDGGWTNPVAVGGPYAPPSNGGGGMRFAYFDSLGGPVTSLANSRSVSRIDLLLRARGQNSSGQFGTSSTVNSDSLAFRIALRNRQ